MKFRSEMSKLAKIGLVVVTGMGLIPSAHAFFRMPCSQPVVVERADPIVSPGAVSGHLHTIMGSSGFNFTEDTSTAMAGQCTSCKAAKDRSNYWIPSLFYQAQNGTVHRVNQIGGSLIYYLQRTDPAKPDEQVAPFPAGFRMLAGDSSVRSYNDTLEQRAVSWVCLNYNGQSPQTANIPNTNCPDGLRAQVFFPSCSNGQLDSSDHKSHMAYPSNMDSGSCPSTHPIRLVSIFYEVIWDTNPWAGMWWHSDGSHPFVLASGDTTGYGHHGDFLNGWDQDALTNAVAKCTQNSGVIEDCQADLELLSDDEMATCINPTRVNELTTGWLPSLPGCNPITSGPARATSVKDGTCGKPAPGILSADQVGFLKKTVPLWDPVGCAADSLQNRLLPTKFTEYAIVPPFENSSTGRWILTLPDSPAMTIEKCGNLCHTNGFTYAGLEWGVECWCGNNFDESKANLYGSCTQPCAGDSTEMCGNAGVLSVYKYDANKASVPTTPSSSSSASSTTTSSSAQASTSASNPAPVPAPPSSSSSSTSTMSTNQASTTPTPSTSSSTSASVPAPTNGTDVPAGWVYRGCYVDTVYPSRSLPGDGMWYAVPMTPSACTDHCAQKGFVIAGTEYAGECYCGNSFQGGAVQKPESDCNMPCKGEPGVMCGGPARMSVYSRDMHAFKRGDPLVEGSDLMAKRSNRTNQSKRDNGLISKHRRTVHGRSRLGI